MLTLWICKNWHEGILKALKLLASRRYHPGVILIIVPTGETLGHGNGALGARGKPGRPLFSALCH